MHKQTELMLVALNKNTGGEFFPGHFKTSPLQSIVFGITLKAIVLHRPSPVWIALWRDQR